MKTLKIRIVAAVLCLLLFAVFTVLVKTVDVAAIGPCGSKVGFASLNRKVQEVVGYHETIYKVTEMLGVLPLISAIAFAVAGLSQWLRRKSLKKVEPVFFPLAGGYILSTGSYILFEIFTVNYRPVMPEGELKASYPSSHTVMALVFFTLAVLTLRYLAVSKKYRLLHGAVGGAVALAIVLGRFFSGVHWCSDIIGGILLSATLICAFLAATGIIYGKKERQAGAPEGSGEKE